MSWPMHLAPSCTVVWGACVVISLAVGTPAAATILTFDQVRSAAAGNPVEPTVSGRDVPLDYGDRVAAGVMDVPGGQFTFGEAGEGFTPNVTTEFFSGAASPIGPGVSLWQDRYGDLANVLLANNASNFLAVRLTADPGYQVGLFGFDLAGWPNADYLIDGISVISDAFVLFSQADVLVEGDISGPRHSAFAFADGLFAAELLLRIDFSNLAGGQHDNIGLDNLRFAQTPPWTPGPSEDPPVLAVPEPGMLSLLGVALLGAWLVRISSSPRSGDIDHFPINARRYGALRRAGVNSSEWDGYLASLLLLATFCLKVWRHCVPSHSEPFTPASCEQFAANPTFNARPRYL